ncbi:hypothetical protein ARALYDRAFT_356160 [Arabidopsis lyrata subsp. lyrata]|uniref:AB hydrolase-1 domain-containing protein n=1 Tax=Arabidopsis lyrata subsp. lyrata TaxID=81972 RepID=D7MK06_ARALL|nr:hypothetical protein ARALYDRAFT_356160 [Arabidopsis lyrata subsp. lyrata]
MEVIEQRRSKSERENPPLVFVHGSYHAAWCWAEHWLPFFSSSGFDSYAVSLLGQGESDEPLGTVAGTLQEWKMRFQNFQGLYLFARFHLRVTLSLAAKGFQKSIPLCRETFFSQAMDDQLVKRYQDLMTESSRMPLFDLRKLNASLPVPKPMENSTKVLVLGAKDDFIVDDEGLKETGWFYCVEPVCIEGVAHDMMLDCSWKKGAEVKERKVKC